MATTQPTTSTNPFRRMSGLPILVALVGAGMLLPAFLQWKVPQLETKREELLGSAPTDPEGKLALWFRFGQAQIHQALMGARFSGAQPWYVSYVRETEGPAQPPEVWGLDLGGLDPGDVEATKAVMDELIRLDGLEVRLVLPEPTLLAETDLSGRKVQGIPRFAAGEDLDGADLTRRRLEGYYFFSKLAAALARDVPGATFVVQVGDSVTPEGGILPSTLPEDEGR